MKKPKRIELPRCFKEDCLIDDACCAINGRNINKIYYGNKVIDEYEAWFKEYKIKSIRKELVVWKSLQLEFEVGVCECGEKWDETDAAVMVNEHIEKLSKVLTKLKDS